MKNLIPILGLVFVLGITGCGPSKQDEVKDQGKQDSIDSLDSNNSVDEANKLFDSINRADSLDSIARLKEGKGEVAQK